MAVEPGSRSARNTSVNVAARPSGQVVRTCAISPANPL